MTNKTKHVSLFFSAYLLFLSSPLLAELSSPLLSISSNAENLTLNWTEVNNATGYRLYYAVYPYKSGDLIQSADMGSTLSFNAKLWDGAAYYVAIQAYSNSETSTFSNSEYFVLGTKHISYTSEAGSFNGLTLIAPMGSRTSYLIDDRGNNKHQWESSFTPALSAYLLKNGNLLRTGSDKNGSFSAGGQGGYIEEMDWEGNYF